MSRKGAYSKGHSLSSSFFHVIYKYITWQTRGNKTNTETTEFLTHRLVEKYSIQNLKKFQFSPLLAAILNFCEKRKNLNISQTIRDRANSLLFHFVFYTL